MGRTSRAAESNGPLRTELFRAVPHPGPQFEDVVIEPGEVGVQIVPLCGPGGPRADAGVAQEGIDGGLPEGRASARHSTWLPGAASGSLRRERTNRTVTYSMGVSPDGVFLVVTVLGSLTAEEASRYTAEAKMLGNRLGIDRVLVDVTGAVNADFTEDSYDFAYRRLKQLSAGEASPRVATLVRPEDHSHDFVLLASRNAGFNVTLFRNREAAETHLRSPDDATHEGDPVGAPPFYSFDEDD